MYIPTDYKYIAELYGQYFEITKQDYLGADVTLWKFKNKLLTTDQNYFYAVMLPPDF